MVAIHSVFWRGEGGGKEGRGGREGGGREGRREGGTCTCTSIIASGSLRLSNILKTTLKRSCRLVEVAVGLHDLKHHCQTSEREGENEGEWEEGRERGRDGGRREEGREGGKEWVGEWVSQ